MSHVPASPDPTMRHRAAEATLTILQPDGRPIADTEIVIEQTCHQFGFGNIGFDFIGFANGETSANPESPFGGAPPSQGQHLADLWFDLFNTATLPFYWGSFEPERGQPDTARLLRTAQWFVEHGVTVKGHPLVWHTVTADWLRDLTTDEVEAAQRARIQREVTDFKGVVDVWDAINEVVIMPIFDNEERQNGITRLCLERGRIATIRMAFEEARAVNPGATLLLNDFDMSAAYECLIEGVLEAGIKIDALGLQSHMHQGYWGEEKTLRIVERFSRYGIPIHFTETTLLSGQLMPPEIKDLNDYQIPSWPSTPDGEERQAEEMVRHYRTLVSHPSVQAINYWGLSDEGAWLGAPVGLVRSDGTTKPSYDALRGLIKGEWWLTPTTMRTDEAGRLKVRGFLGDYQLTAGATTTSFALAAPGQVTSTVTLPGG